MVFDKLLSVSVIIAIFCTGQSPVKLKNELEENKKINAAGITRGYVTPGDAE
jgi:hypothetical protein